MSRCVAAAVLALAACGPGRADAPRATPGSVPAPRATEPAPVASAVAPIDPVVAACENGDKAACASLASRCGIGMKGDVPWASAACAERERKACYAGDAFFCRKLSDRYTSVTDDVGVPKDEVMAAKLVERACEGGDVMDSCMNIAARYETGEGVAKDLARAVAFWERACEGDSGVPPQGCQRLADHLVLGDGGPKDEARAARLYAAACFQGVCRVEDLEALCSDASGRATTNAGCVSLAAALVMPVAGAPEMQPSKAKRLLERACKRRDAAGCRALARWYTDGMQWSETTRIAPDKARAAAYLKQACDAGDKTACDAP